MKIVMTSFEEPNRNVILMIRFRAVDVEIELIKNVMRVHKKSSWLQREQKLIS